MQSGRVSLIVASYNYARLLPRRMDSLIAQTYPGVEIIAIDDRSPDNSVEILRRYEEHPKVRVVVREQNGGWVAVSNQGVDLTSGEYILFANCDDDCDPRMVERLVDALQRHPSAGVAFCRSVMIDDDGNVIGDDFAIREKAFRQRCATDTFIPGTEMRRFLMHSCVIPNLSAALIRRDCFEAAGRLPTGYRACSDWDLFFRIAERADFCYVAEPLNRFRQHAGTIRSATKGRITYDEFFRLLLGEIQRGGLSAGERFRFRLHVMYLWAIELMRPSTSGWRNFPHHFRMVCALDPAALPLLPLAMLRRLGEVPGKVWRRLARLPALPEWDNFILHARLSPWLWPRYGLDLGRLIARRCEHALRRRLMKKAAHLGLKRWPAWLGSRDIAIEAGIADLLFPSYPSPGTMVPMAELPRQHFAASDPEAALAGHRWGGCLEATLAGEADARDALQEVMTWIRTAPPREDGAWEPYSSCERVVNLAVMLAAHPVVWAEADAGARAEIGRFFAASARWIHDHLEYYGDDRTNNHILNNARALIVAGRLLNNDALLARGLILLSRMAAVLFLPDGCLRERSSHYQMIVANWILDALHFSAAGPVPSAAAAARAELAALGARIVAATSNFLAVWENLESHIGDISPDQHPRLTRLRLFRLYPDAAGKQGMSGRLDDWAFVARGTHRLLACGMAGEYPFEHATHGHDDIGSFIWSAEGRVILADPGRATYAPGETARRQCAADGHNTLMLNGLPPLAGSLLTAGLWRPRPYAAASVALEVRDGGFSVRHDGFRRIAGVTSHERMAKLADGGLTVEDHVEGSGEVSAALHWHFAPGFVPDGAAACLDAASGRRIAVICDNAPVGDWSWERYAFSDAYGKTTEAWALRMSMVLTLPAKLVTRLDLSSCAA